MPQYTFTVQFKPRCRRLPMEFKATCITEVELLVEEATGLNPSAIVCMDIRLRARDRAFDEALCELLHIGGRSVENICLDHDDDGMMFVLPALTKYGIIEYQISDALVDRGQSHDVYAWSDVAEAMDEIQSNGGW